MIKWQLFGFGEAWIAGTRWMREEGMQIEDVQSVGIVSNAESVFSWVTVGK
jgi:hypothetical protein